jgi:hypothetical protein
MDRIYIHPSGAELWQGGMYDVDRLLRLPSDKIRVIGLFAQEYQPDDPHGYYELLKSGFDDNPDAGPVELSKIASTADSASDTLSNRLRAGKSCLSSCAAGLNRSGIVTALTLMKVAGLDSTTAINTIRKRRPPQRGMSPLCNPKFVHILHKMQPVVGDKSTWTEWRS